MIHDISRYCFDAGPIALFIAGMVLLAGVTFIVSGVGGVLPLDLTGRHFKRLQALYWEGGLRRLGLATDATDFAPALAENWTRVSRPAMTGAGIALVMAAFVGSIASWMLTGTLILWTGLGYAAAYAVAFTLGAAGYAGGLLWSVGRVQASSERRAASLVRRRLSDYRPWQVPACLFLLIVYCAVRSLVYSHFLGRYLTIEVGDGTRFLVPNQLWTVTILPACMFLALLWCELGMARVTAFPRLFFQSTADRAVLVDDLLRVRALRTLQGAEIAIVACLALCQMFLTDFGMGYVHVWYVGVLGMIEAYVMLPAAVFAVVGSVCMMSFNPAFDPVRRRIVHVPEAA